MWRYRLTWNYYHRRFQKYNMKYLRLTSVVHYNYLLNPKTLTGSYHLVHAWHCLFAELVARPTHECPVIEWCQWRVGGSAPRSLLSVTVTVQVDSFPRVVETPSVPDVVRRVGLHLAQHFSSFTSAHPLHRLLAGPTYWGDWNINKYENCETLLNIYIQYL